MIQRPSAVSLVLCDDILIEHNTKSATLIRCFNKLTFRSFPTGPRPFWVYAMLTDGLGPVPLSLSITRLDTMERVYDRSWQMTFSDPLRIVKVPFHVGSCSFPVATRYEIVLSAGNEALAATVLTVVLQE